MYQRLTEQDVLDGLHLSDVGSLGLSLKPPKWLREAVSSAVKAVTPRITVQTPAGPVSVDASNTAEVRQLVSQLQPTVTFGQSQPTALDRAGAMVEQIPGGVGTIAIAGAALIGLFMLMGRRRA